MSGMFLDETEIAQLTGRKMKGHQITALRQMGVPFRINATGHPVVLRSALEGGRIAEKLEKKTWEPKVFRSA